MAELKAEAMPSHTIRVGIIGPAWRLRVVGHTDAQATLPRAHPLFTGRLSAPGFRVDEGPAFYPYQDNAAIWRQTMLYPLFIN